MGITLKDMKKEDLKPFVNKFGMIRAGQPGYKKTMHGHIKEMDSRGNVWFEDLDFGGLVFRAEDIDTFEPKEFSPLAEKYKGRDVYWKGGRVYYSDTHKECDINK